MIKLLKSRLKQTFILHMDSKEALELVEGQFKGNWHINVENSQPQKLVFRADRADIKISGYIERWEETKSRLYLDGHIALKTPYETWREWTGLSTALLAALFWSSLAYLPPTAIPFQQLYFIMSHDGNLLMLLMFFMLLIFLVIPYFFQRYFTQHAFEIRRYNECQHQLAQFFAAWQEISESQKAATVRLQDSEHVLALDGVVEAMRSAQSQA